MLTRRSFFRRAAAIVAAVAIAPEIVFAGRIRPFLSALGPVDEDYSCVMLGCNPPHPDLIPFWVEKASWVEDRTDGAYKEFQVEIMNSDKWKEFLNAR